MRFLERLYFFLTLLICAAATWRPFGPDADVWEHGAIGRWIVSHSQIPHQTLFLWSAKIPWVAHSWLYEILIYRGLSAGNEHFGVMLTLAVNAFLTVSCFVLLWRLCASRGRITFLTVFLFLLAVQVAQPRFQPRPETFTALFLTILLIFLAQWPRISPAEYSRRRIALSMLGLAALFALWTNCHGVVALGILVLAITIVCEVAQERAERRTFVLAGLGIVALAATMLNPYGLGYWQALRSVSSLTFRTIDEWKPFWQSPALEPELVINQIVLWVLALVAWWRGNTPKNMERKRARRWSQVAWLLLFFGLWLSARRYVWLLAVVSLVVLADNAAALDPRRLWHEWQQNKRMRQDASAEDAVGGQGLPVPEAAPPRGLVLLAHIATVAALMLAFWQMWPLELLKPDRGATKLTAKVLQLYETGQLRDRVFNAYNDSAYLQWRFGGRPEIFIDSLNAYPDIVAGECLHIFHATRTGQQLIDNYGINTVILPHLSRQADPPELLYLLYKNPKWDMVYVGGDGVVFTRKSPLPLRPIVRALRRPRTLSPAATVK